MHQTSPAQALAIVTRLRCRRGRAEGGEGVKHAAVRRCYVHAAVAFCVDVV